MAIAPDDQVKVLADLVSAVIKVVSVVDIVKVTVSVVATTMVAVLVIHLDDQVVKYLEQFNNNTHQTAVTNTKLIAIDSCIWFLFLRLKL